MKQRVDNYAIQAEQAKKLFLTYDQQELIHRCRLEYDKDYFYFRFLGDRHRICRHSGNMQRLYDGAWREANGFNEVLTVLDWLCDSKPERFTTGNWINPVTQGPGFHVSLQENGKNHHALLFDAHPQAFQDACLSLGGEQMPGADMSFAIEMVDGLQVLVQLWHGDDEFAPRLRCLWDENTAMYLRYETTWYAAALLMHRIKERMVIA